MANDIIHTHRYQISSVPGFKPFWLVMYTTGPVVILPISFLFMLLGKSVLTGRIVILAFNIGLFLVMYKFTKKVAGTNVAITQALLYPLTYYSYGQKFPPLQRSVYGEIPMIFFLFTSLFLYLRLYPKNIHKKRYLLTIGLSLGLSTLAKIQVLFLIIPIALYLLATRKILRTPNTIALCLIGFLSPILLFHTWQLLETGFAETVSRIYEIILHARSNDGSTKLLYSLIHLPQVIKKIPLLSTIGLYLLKSGKVKSKNTSILTAIFITQISAIILYVMGNKLGRYIIPSLLLNLPLASLAVTYAYKTNTTSKLLLWGIYFILLIQTSSMISITDKNNFITSEFIKREIPASKTIESNDWPVIFLTERKYNQQIKSFFWFNNKIGKDYGKLRKNDEIKKINSDYILVDIKRHTQVYRSYKPLLEDKKLIFSKGGKRIYKNN